MKRITILITAILLMTSCAVQKNLLDDSNRWEGLGYQSNTDTKWTMIVKKKSANIYSITYPDIPCSGEWKLVSIGVDRMMLTENITKDKQNCVVNSDIIITKINEQNLSVVFFLPKSSEVFAFATIKK